MRFAFVCVSLCCALLLAGLVACSETGDALPQAGDADSEAELSPDGDREPDMDPDAALDGDAEPPEHERDAEPEAASDGDGEADAEELNPSATQDLGDPCRFGALHPEAGDCAYGRCFGAHLLPDPERDLDGLACFFNHDCQKSLGSQAVCVGGYCGFSICTTGCEYSHDCEESFPRHTRWCCTALGIEYESLCVEQTNTFCAPTP